MIEKKAEKRVKKWTEKWTEKRGMLYGEKNKMVHNRYHSNERTWRLFFERR